MNTLRKGQFDELAKALPLSPWERAGARASAPLSGEGIENLHSGLLEIAGIAGGDREVMQERGRGDEAVLVWHRATGSAKLREQLRPAYACGGINRQTDEVLNPLRKPKLETLSARPGGHQLNAEADFAEDDRIHHQLGFVGAEPLQHLRFGRRLGGLAQHIGVNEEGHSKDGILMSSVVSANSSGRNQPFSGHFKSQSTSPSFLRRFTRFSRYSPLSMRSTSNCWPGLMPSCWRISAGRTICPLLDTVVVMPGKIPSYPAAVNGGATFGLISGLKARPHPGPLPQEREDRSERLWPAADLGGGAAFARKRNNAPNATSAFELTGAARMLSLSSGERAGVRASVPLTVRGVNRTRASNRQSPPIRSEEHTSEL